MLGVSPTLIRALIPKGEPQHDLSSLKAMCTTGEPWNRDPYLWLFDHVGGGPEADAQPADVDVDRARVDVAAHLPHLLE